MLPAPGGCKDCSFQPSHWPQDIRCDGDNPQLPQDLLRRPCLQRLRNSMHAHAHACTLTAWTLPYIIVTRGLQSPGREADPLGLTPFSCTTSGTGLSILRLVCSGDEVHTAPSPRARCEIKITDTSTRHVPPESPGPLPGPLRFESAVQFPSYPVTMVSELVACTGFLFLPPYASGPLHMPCCWL